MSKKSKETFQKIKHLKEEIMKFHALSGNISDIERKRALTDNEKASRLDFWEAARQLKRELKPLLGKWWNVADSIHTRTYRLPNVKYVSDNDDVVCIVLRKKVVAHLVRKDDEWSISFVNPHNLLLVEKLQQEWDTNRNSIGRLISQNDAILCARRLSSGVSRFALDELRDSLYGTGATTS